MPTKINFKVYQGSTFNEVIRWESSVKTYKAITGITKAAPAVLTVVGHGAPPGWRVTITDVLGMKEINSSDTYRTATVSGADEIILNEVNAASYTAYVSGGVVTYNSPVSLVGFTARMQIRASLTSETILDTLTTENSKILLDTENNTITLNIPATDTAAYTWSSGVYSLELESSSGVVTTIANGNVTLVKEVTR